MRPEETPGGRVRRKPPSGEGGVSRQEERAAPRPGGMTHRKGSRKPLVQGRVGLVMTHRTSAWGQVFPVPSQECGGWELG